MYTRPNSPKIELPIRAMAAHISHQFRKTKFVIGSLSRSALGGLPTNKAKSIIDKYEAINVIK